MKNPDIALWWTPEGFVSLEAPESLKAIYQGTNDWKKAIMEAGYETLSSIGSEPDELQLTIYMHKSDHYFVEMWNDSIGLGYFCVALENTDRFFLTWYMDFVKAHSISNLADIIRPLKKTLIAFVRYGHGTETIDEDGFWSLDDQSNWEQRKRAAELEKYRKATEKKSNE